MNSIFRLFQLISGYFRINFNFLKLGRLMWIKSDSRWFRKVPSELGGIVRSGFVRFGNG
jgi:hypothetical protein